jgi:hypothetical protein
MLSVLCWVRLDKSEKASEEVGLPSPAGGTAFSGQVNLVPIAILVIAIVLGSLLGLRARTRQWLAELPEHHVKK